MPESDKKRIDAAYINEAILRDKIREYMIYHLDLAGKKAYFEIDPKGVTDLANHYALTEDEVQLLIFTLSHRVFKTSINEFFRTGFDGDTSFYNRMLHSVETNWEE